MRNLKTLLVSISALMVFSSFGITGNANGFIFEETTKLPEKPIREFPKSSIVPPGFKCPKSPEDLLAGKFNYLCIRAKLLKSPETLTTEQCKIFFCIDDMLRQLGEDFPYISNCP